MHSGKDGEFSPLDVEDLHHQKDQHGDHVLAAVEPIAHLVDTASDGSPDPEADLCGTARPLRGQMGVEANGDHSSLKDL